MSYEDYERAVRIIDSFPDKIDLIHPQTELNVENAEKILQVKFPRSYRMFLTRYGWLMSAWEDIYGLTNENDFDNAGYHNIVKLCVEKRTKENPSFPNYLIPIHALGNGELSCLDTSQMNENEECPVVAWYFGATLPNGKLEVLAEDFGAFLLEKIRWGLEQ